MILLDHDQSFDAAANPIGLAVSLGFIQRPIGILPVIAQTPTGMLRLRAAVRACNRGRLAQRTIA